MHVRKQQDEHETYVHLNVSTPRTFLERDTCDEDKVEAGVPPKKFEEGLDHGREVLAAALTASV